MGHQFNEGDYAQRVVFTENMHAINEGNGNVVIMVSDEAHFHLNGVVNEDNCRYWATGSPRHLQEIPLRSSKVMFRVYW